MLLYGKNQKSISNTNELLGNFEGVYGIKTGFTFNAGRCLVTACKRNNLDIIIVVLGADTKKIRTFDSVKVINYIFSNYTKIDISNIIYEEFYKFEKYFSTNVAIEKSLDSVYLDFDGIKNTTFPLQKQEINNIFFEIYSISKIKSPMIAKTKIGQIDIKIGNDTLASSNIYLKNNITKKTWNIYYKEIFKNFFKI